MEDFFRITRKRSAVSSNHVVQDILNLMVQMLTVKLELPELLNMMIYLSFLLDHRSRRLTQKQRKETKAKIRLPLFSTPLKLEAFIPVCTSITKKVAKTAYHVLGFLPRANLTFSVP